MQPSPADPWGNAQDRGQHAAVIARNGHANAGDGAVHVERGQVQAWWHEKQRHSENQTKLARLRPRSRRPPHLAQVAAAVLGQR